MKKCLVHPVYGAGIRTHNLRNMSLLPLPLDHSMYMFSFPLVVHVSFGHYSFEMACLMLLKFGPNCSSLLAPIFQKNSFPSFLGSFCSSLLKMGQSRPLFVYFRSFLITISIQIEKSIDGVLGIRTWGCRMVGADKTTELWRHPLFISLPLLSVLFLF